MGASEIAALMQVDSFDTPFTLYHKKKSGITGDSNPLMEFGKIMEPIIANLIVDNYHWRLVRCEEYHEHPDYPYLGCTLDYYVVDSEHGAGILQIKNVNPFALGWTQDRAPDCVEWQVQQELLVTNAAREKEGLAPFKWAAIGSLHSGNPEDIRIMMRSPDIKAHDKIIERSIKFWSDLQNNIEPDILEPKDYELVNDIFKQAEIKSIEALDLSNDEILNEEINNLSEEHLRLVNLANSSSKQAAATKAALTKKFIDMGANIIKTSNFIIEAKTIQVNYKARPSNTSKQLRLNIKSIRES